ncbi:MAG: deoxyguanosinetriphosphate triphosphohydrolase [Acidobacteria bacterium]|nr:MAG: deoxyguanosinetriphosphate triphosphohydrolase [Acidobacteriota bacterium]
MIQAQIRQLMEERESQTLSPHAALSSQTRRRECEEPPCPIRTAFQRDRDRILHSKSFRRLKHKTQVFLSPEGDHYRTRLTHTLEVSQIARTISRALKLNEDLTEAIGLGHDLGHTPFGHAGEAILNEIVPGGFRHYEQSLRVVEKLESEGKGLNLTWEVRDGILKHSKGTGAVFTKQDMGRPATLEGQVVRVSDIIAYVNHDIDDAIRSGLIEASDIPKSLTEILGDSHSRRINSLVSDVIHASLDGNLEAITMSPKVLQAMLELRQFLYRLVYALSIPKQELFKAKKMLNDIYHHLLENPENFLAKFRREGDSIEQAATDFVAGMTDRFAINLYGQLFLPKIQV